jgi:hypothetical protein
MLPRKRMSEPLQSSTSRLIFGLAAIVGTTAFAIAATRDLWGIGTPDGSHSHGVRFKGGVTLFFGTGLGWFLDSAIWILLGLTVIATVTEWRARK